MIYNIAIDGPAGAGKSTVARNIAKLKGLVYIDSGSLYRAVSVYLDENNIDYNNKEEVIKSLENISIELDYNENGSIVILNGIDITNKLRTENISIIASLVSPIAEVRRKLLEMQQLIAKTKSVVMDGRDICSVVLPDANLKVYLDAKPEERAKRRTLELKEKGESSNYDEILADIKLRDYRDETREESPLIKTEDAIYIDATHLDINQTTEAVLKHITI